MYLPDEIPNARVLITVKTYPLPNTSYGETVCTAGLLEGDKWIRIYPISWGALSDERKYPKYGWTELDLVRNKSDFRQESYKPRRGFEEEIRVTGKMGTADAWAARKEYVLREVFTSMTDLISLAMGESAKSLATFRPREITKFVIEEETEREWKQGWLDQFRQMNFLDMSPAGQLHQRRLVKKMPYRFYYEFLAEEDDRPHKLIIQDWEIGALFWQCLRRAGGDEEAAKRLVRQKYQDEFLGEKDIFFFLGTTFQFHKRKMANPFVIVGVYYPPKTPQLSLL